MRKLSRIIVYLLFLLIVAEVALRVGSHFLMGTPVLDIRRFRSDPYVFWKFNPGFQGRFYTYHRARINRLGYLGKEIAIPKPAGTIRVVALGGSVSFGYGASAVEDNFCSSLERMLNEGSNSARYEVINAGVPGYSSWNGRQWVEHYLAALQPDVLLVAYGWNDSLLDIKPDNDPAKRTSYHDPVEHFPYNVSLMAGLVRRAVMIIGFKTGLIKHVSEEERTDALVRVTPDQFRDNLAAIATWCRAHDVKLLLWTEPEANLQWKSRAFERRSGLHAAYLDAMRRSAEDLKVPLADVARVFSAMDAKALFAYPQDDYVHPDKRGQEQMARVVVETLQRAEIVAPAVTQ